ncbi:MAG: nucleotidyltransferase domain-containing protein [Nitrospirae bacterium]|nr:nucleotidyltransferase domain-containing protein [Nitrospirota bacterium]
MIKIDELKKIITIWAQSLQYRTRIHLFGSYLKGKQNPSDIDISLEFLHPFSEDERTEKWVLYHRKWEKHLSETTGEKIELSLYKGHDSPQMQQNLKDASMLLYDSDAIQQGDES